MLVVETVDKFVSDFAIAGAESSRLRFHRRLNGGVQHMQNEVDRDFVCRDFSKGSVFDF